MEKVYINNRQLFLLVSLNEDEYLTSQELADVLEVSVRTIKNEISNLRRLFNCDLLRIKSKPGYGYKIIINDFNYFEEITGNINKNYIKQVHNFSKDSYNRITYIIRKLLITNKYIKINELANELFVSRSTLENDINEIRIQLKKFNIKIISKPKYGLKIKSSEFDLRRCISEYYFNHPVKIPTLIDINEENTLQKIESILIEKSNKNYLMLSEFSIKNIAIHIYISIFRFENSFHYKENKDIFSTSLSTKSIITATEIYQSLRNTLNIKFTETEIMYLALHLDSKQIIEDPQKNIEKDKEVLRKIIKEIKRNFNLDFSRDSLLIKFLLQHIPQMINRIRRGLVIRNPLLQENMRKYLFALKITESAVHIIEENYNLIIPLDEFGYLMLYFQNALNRIKKTRKIIIGFIMGRGRADTIVYQQEIRSKLPLEEFEILSFQNLQEAKNSQDPIDILVSVYPTSTLDFNYKVNIETGDYLKKINEYAHEIQIEEVKIDKYVKQEYFISNLKGKTKEDIYQNIVSILKVNKIITEDIDNQEPFVAQEVGNEILHLQDLYKICRHPIGFIGILEEPIIWDKSVVKVIVLIKTKRDGDKDLPIICQLFSDFISDGSKVANLKEKKNFVEFKENLINI